MLAQEHGLYFGTFRGYLNKLIEQKSIQHFVKSVELTAKMRYVLEILQQISRSVFVFGSDAAIPINPIAHLQFHYKFKIFSHNILSLRGQVFLKQILRYNLLIFFKE